MDLGQQFYGQASRVKTPWALAALFVASIPSMFATALFAPIHEAARIGFGVVLIGLMFLLPYKLPSFMRNMPSHDKAVSQALQGDYDLIEVAESGRGTLRIARTGQREIKPPKGGGE